MTGSWAVALWKSDVRCQAVAAMAEGLEHPERVLGVVAVCGSSGRPLDTFHGHNGLNLAFPFLHALVRRFPRAVSGHLSPGATIRR